MSATVIDGTDNSDWLSGGEEDSIFNAKGGDDEIHTTFGTNFIDGGDGNDTLVIYEGKRDDFTVHRLANGHIHLEGKGLFGRTLINDMVNVERVVFTDQELDLSEITYQNSDPVAKNDYFAVENSSVLNGNVLTNDYDDPDQQLQTIIRRQPVNGTVTLLSNGDFTYVPKKDFSGIDTFKYSVIDSAGGWSTALARIEVIESAPVNVLTEPEISEGSVADLPDSTSTVAANEPPVQIVEVSSNELDGSATVETNNTLDELFQPITNIVNQGSQLLDNLFHNGSSETSPPPAATLPEPEPSPNLAPIAIDDNFLFGGSLSLGNVSVNDSDPDGQNYELRYEILSNPEVGRVDFYSDGSFEYWAKDGFNGEEEFRYRVRDQFGLWTEANVTIVVNQPVTIPEVAAPEVTTPEVTAPEVTAPETGGLTTPGSSEVNSVGAITPSEPVTIAPNEPTEPNVTEPPETAKPVPVVITGTDIVAAKSGSATANNVLTNDGSEGSLPLAVLEFTAAQYGTVSVTADGQFVYQSDSNYQGIDYFHYTVSDGENFDRQTVVIHVNPDGQLDPAPLEFLQTDMVVSPIAFDLNNDGVIGVTGETTAKDKSSISAIGATVSFDIDGDGEAESIEWLDGKGDGLLVDISKIKGRNIDGTALFGDEGGLYANGYEKLAKLDIDGNTLLDNREIAQLKLWVDNGDGKLALGELQELSKYNISSISTQITAKNGLMQSWAFTRDDGRILTEDVWFAEKDTDTTEQNANENNRRPDADPDVLSTNINTRLTGNVLLNDNDPDGDRLLVTRYTQALHGELKVSDDGNFTYTPDADFSGVDYFQYVISDGRGGTDTAVVMLNVVDTSAAATVSGHVIKGTIWQDGDPGNGNSNLNGIRDTNETVAGTSVFVSLLNDNGTVIQSVHSDGDGQYIFSGLKDGTYSVQVAQASLPQFESRQTLVTVQNVNSNFYDVIYSDLDPVSGRSAEILLQSIDEQWETAVIDAGYYHK